MAGNNARRTALIFIVLLGFVSLFADMTYESARSMTGQYLAVLGASGAVVSIVSGFGEGIGYGLRLLSGYLSDRTGKYWTMTIAGYVMNLVAVPLLAFAGNWQLAAVLLILERIGKSFRGPPRDAMLSYATHQMGHGAGFGLHEAMDQIGAVTGPLLISIFLYLNGSYAAAFAVLAIPALIALGVLFYAKSLYPNPQELEPVQSSVSFQGLNKTFWLYITAVGCIGAGFVDFPLIAYHWHRSDLFSTAFIPLLFAVAMAADGISALIMGRLFDKIGIALLILSVFVTGLFAPLIFLLENQDLAVVGLLLWGIGLGIQESVVRAFIATLVEPRKRGTAYGILNMFFGLAWFLGSVCLGLLYDVNLIGLVIFSVGMQWLAIPFLYAVKRSMVIPKSS